MHAHAQFVYVTSHCRSFKKRLAQDCLGRWEEFSQLLKTAKFTRKNMTISIIQYMFIRREINVHTLFNPILFIFTRCKRALFSSALNSEGPFYSESLKWVSTFVQIQMIMCTVVDNMQHLCIFFCISQLWKNVQLILTKASKSSSINWLFGIN